MTDSLVVSEHLIKLTLWLTYATIASAVCAIAISFFAFLTYRYNRRINKAYLRINPSDGKKYVSAKDSVKFPGKKLLSYEVIYKIYNAGREPIIIDELMFWNVNFCTEEDTSKKDKPILTYLTPKDRMEYKMKFEDETTSPSGSITPLQQKIKADFLFAIMIKYHNVHSIFKWRDKALSLFLYNVRTNEFQDLNDEQLSQIRVFLPKKLKSALHL